MKIRCSKRKGTDEFSYEHDRCFMHVTGSTGLGDQVSLSKIRAARVYGCRLRQKPQLVLVVADYIN